MEIAQLFRLLVSMSATGVIGYLIGKADADLEAYNIGYKEGATTGRRFGEWQAFYEVADIILSEELKQTPEWEKCTETYERYKKLNKE